MSEGDVKSIWRGPTGFWLEAGRERHGREMGILGVLEMPQNAGDASFKLHRFCFCRISRIRRLVKQVVFGRIL